jgi:hypothetical protein
MLRAKFGSNPNVTFIGINPNADDNDNKLIDIINLFDDDETSSSEDEEYYVVAIRNGYGASIIRHPTSYGYERGLYELAVISNIEYEKGGGGVKSFDLNYETPITDDVLGYLTPEDVINTIREIIKLPNYKDEKGGE